MTRQDKTRHDTTKQSQDKTITRQDNYQENHKAITRQGKAHSITHRHTRARTRTRAREEKRREDFTRQDLTRQDLARQDETRQDKGKTGFFSFYKFLTYFWGVLCSFHEVVPVSRRVFAVHLVHGHVDPTFHCCHLLYM